jgi:hypothetical protein
MDARAATLEVGPRGRLSASDAAVVVARLLDHVGGKERAAGSLDVGGASTVAASRSHHGGQV